MPWVFRPNRHRHVHPQHQRPTTGAPICVGGGNRLHPPVHCKRTGHGFIYANYRPRWTCPACGMNHYR